MHHDAEPVGPGSRTHRRRGDTDGPGSGRSRQARRHHARPRRPRPRDHALQRSAEPGGTQGRPGHRGRCPDGPEAAREDATVGDQAAPGIDGSGPACRSPPPGAWRFCGRRAPGSGQPATGGHVHRRSGGGPQHLTARGLQEARHGAGRCRPHRRGRRRGSRGGRHRDTLRGILGGRPELPARPAGDRRPARGRQVAAAAPRPCRGDEPGSETRRHHGYGLLHRRGGREPRPGSRAPQHRCRR